ncbi:MAG: FliM/FliN family flagellar motor switch protein [Pseudomonadota bacterium]
MSQDIKGSPSVKPLADVYIDISVVLGTATMPVHQLLRMGRGAVIDLEALETAPVKVLANDQPIAEANVVLNEERICIEITKMLTRMDNLN